MDCSEVITYLEQHRDAKRATFNQRICCTNLPVYGVEASALRRLAKQISMQNDFLKYPRQQSHEMEVLIGMAYAYQRRPMMETLDFLTEFFQSTTSWAIVDSVTATLKMQEDEAATIFQQIVPYMQSTSEMVARFAHVFCLRFYCKKPFLQRYLLNFKEDKRYYCSMAQAWFLSFAYSYEPEITFSFFQAKQMSPLLWKRTKQKIRDSYRISAILKKRLDEVKE